ncbi:carbohydrate binding domain-containing protein [Acidicapsa acidisoli]|uniref:carbohydrate binding domain-containing protein n=1 Tax=Acidicapsa acidisoli TaxID=1615681 RepID=UPI0021E096A7|nr:carbohydrate binding domain-containing protein [Acidicapsa acidisoli]
MNRRHFLIHSTAAAVTASLASNSVIATVAAEESRVAVLVIDTDRASVPIDKRIYGQFLEHINHSVEDGLFAEQIRGAGFEGPDFQTYWEPISQQGHVEVAQLDFQNGKKSVRLRVDGGEAGIRQKRIFLEDNTKYEGSLWVKGENGSPKLTLGVLGSTGNTIASVPLVLNGTDWHELPFSFTSHLRDTQASIEITASGHGALLIDFVSLMRSDVRHDGMLRPDLLNALCSLEPSFIRWPGGSFASTYKWKEAVGRYAARGYHPNIYWGNYSDYAGFGTDEFLGLCKRLNCEPLIVLAAPTTKQEDLDYAMNWVHYLNDPPSTEWGRLRTQNGHPEPYNVRYFQIDNEPMNNGFTPESYAGIVNIYGRRLRAIVPGARIVACGQKRSNDMDWSKKVIDIAGNNFDILGCHNYEYEPDNFASGIDRIRGYLTNLCEYVRASRHPNIEVAVLEWSLQHTYDWRAGLHAAGSLIMYEELSPGLTMTCPALLMRNTTDDPKWTSAIYHDHVSWFPGGSYVVEKLFRQHFAPRYLASAAGTIRDVPDRKLLFDKISTQIPSGWLPDSVDAIATTSEDNRRIVIKAVNYQGNRNTLLVRLQGNAAPERATATLHIITARLNDQASIENPEVIAPVSRPFTYGKDLTIDLDPYTVAVLEIHTI